jgi:hypothetical protein
MQFFNRIKSPFVIHNNIVCIDISAMLSAGIIFKNLQIERFKHDNILSFRIGLRIWFIKKIIIINNKLIIIKIN